jgi:hypothetical protein
MSPRPPSESELTEPMSLKHLSDADLILSTQSALRDLRQAEVLLLRHFAEIAERRLWTEAGSLYKFLAQTFNLTDDQIYPRLQATRLLQALPEIEVKIESGQLSVTNALKAQQVFTAESKTRLVTKEEKREVIASLENTSTRESDRILATRYPQSKLLPEKVKPRSRYISAVAKRELEKTRAKGCAHKVRGTGLRCGSKYFLQMDHIHEFYNGGSNAAENLQWLCGFHNRHRFETGGAAALR